MNKNKVVLGVSGGVDSAVAAEILKRDGYEVIGVTLICHESQKNSEDLNDAKKLCEKLKIEHIVVDVIEKFKKEVIDYFLEEYSKGRTPSPCIICDEKIKIKTLLDVANKNNAYFIATGHYSEVSRDNIYGKNLLKKVKDLRKDQGYMLYRIKELDRLLFPLSNLTKSEVREKAKKYGIEMSEKKDSQGICFAKEGYIKFLKNNLKEKIKKGEYIDSQGKSLGTHEGYQLYTFGQRRGLGVLLSKPYFITDINPKNNKITLGEYSELNRKKIELKKVVLHIPIEELKEKILIGRPRFSSRGFTGKLYSENGRIYFEYLEENPQNAKGQHLVIYDNEFIIGGGIISF